MPASRFETIPGIRVSRDTLADLPFTTQNSSLNSFRFALLRNSASINSLDSDTNKKPHINIKTKGFKPSRITLLRMPFSQTLWNHTITKNGVGEGLAVASARQNGAGHAWSRVGFSTKDANLSTALHSRTAHRRASKGSKMVLPAV